MRILTLSALLMSATPALATMPLACESDTGDAFLSILGPVAQFWHTDSRRTGSATHISQDHDGFPSAWHIAIETATGIAVVDEKQCATKHGRFPLSFVMVTDDHLMRGCCTVAE
ncbi:MAG: hypothetical protein JXR15_10175 [Shimia sp.]|uniref:hypothetical protein n=1 Tax=Shimia sp. TaxID=1954381 RepID=UPI003B8B46BE